MHVPTCSAHTSPCPHTVPQDASCLYLVLDFVPGGDMFAFLRDLPRRTGRKMPEMHARFYAAQLVLALEHLHSQGIAYRDLKVRT